MTDLKTIGLVLAAALALGAVGAPAASAQNPVDHIESDSETGLTELTGVGTDHVFTITEPDVAFECATASFTATMSENLERNVTTNASYEGTPGGSHEGHCASGVGTVVVDMNGCDYLLTGATNREHEERATAEVHIVCPENKEIEITASSGCNIDIPPQTPTAGGVSYTQTEEEGTKTITVDAHVTGITYTSTGFVCALAGIPSEANDADYAGTVEITGHEENGAGETLEPANLVVAEFPVDHIESDSETGLTELTGVGTDHVFTITEPDVAFECATASFAATMSENLETDITADVQYTGTSDSEAEEDSEHCDSSIGTLVWDMNGCDYLLTGATNREHEEKDTAEVHIECEKEGEEIEATGSSGCDIDIPPQTPTAGGVSYTQTEEEGTKTITVDAHVTGITYTSTGFVCALAGIPSEANNLDYAGMVEITGHEENEAGETLGPANLTLIETE